MVSLLEIGGKKNARALQNPDGRVFEFNIWGPERMAEKRSFEEKK